MARAYDWTTECTPHDKIGSAMTPDSRFGIGAGLDCANRLNLPLVGRRFVEFLPIPVLLPEFVNHVSEVVLESVLGSRQDRSLLIEQTKKIRRFRSTDVQNRTW